MSKADYLKKYLSGGDADRKKKKKKGKNKEESSSSSSSALSRMKIVEDDAFIHVQPAISTNDDEEEDEETGRPVIKLHSCNTEELRMLGKFKANTFQPLPEKEEESSRRHDTSSSSDEDQDPHGDKSRDRTRSRHDSDDKTDNSPPRRPRTMDTVDDLSPPRRRAPDVDEDNSPPRRRRSSPQSDVDEDKSPPRRRRSSPQSDHHSGTKTLDGKRAGLQSARSLREETIQLKAAEKRMFNKIDDEISGRGAQPIQRSKKTGKHNAEDEAKKAREKAKQTELEEKYKVWNRGIAQIQRHGDKRNEEARVAAEAFARAADNEAMNEHLRTMQHKDDPMLAYMMKKKDKVDAETGAIVYPRYSGPRPAPNRFGIEPGHRWDGVDRSTGFEARLFTSSNDRSAVEKEYYKWSAGMNNASCSVSVLERERSIIDEVKREGHFDAVRKNCLNRLDHDKHFPSLVSQVETFVDNFLNNIPYSDWNDKGKIRSQLRTRLMQQPFLNVELLVNRLVSEEEMNRELGIEQRCRRLLLGNSNVDMDISSSVEPLTEGRQLESVQVDEGADMSVLVEDLCETNMEMDSDVEVDEADGQRTTMNGEIPSIENIVLCPPGTVKMEMKEEEEED